MNTIFNLPSVISLLRTIAYMWIGTSLLSLAFLYHYGYDHLKPTPVICALHKMLLFLGILFIFLGFLPVMAEVDIVGTSYTVARMLVLLFLLPVGYYVRKFRQESLKESKPRNLKKSKERSKVN